VATSPLTCAANEVKGRLAGPLTTAPEVLNVAPWHGQTNCEPENRVIAQLSWVQVAVRTLTVSAPVRVSKKAPTDVCVIAMAKRLIEPR